MRAAFGGQRTACRATLTFRELETFARAGLSGFFALLHARVPAKQSFRFQRASQIAIDLKKSTRDGKLGSASLPHDATAGRVNRQIISIHRLGSLKRLEHDVLERHSWEIIFKAATIDVDLAAPRRHADARDRCFAATRGNKFLSFWHRI